MQTEQTFTAIQTTKEIMDLFANYGNNDYDGEPVTQTSHMVQCAMLAMGANADQELVLGAFLHDIGHLIGHNQKAADMHGLGAVNHEAIGAAYLQKHHFGERVCAVVEGHVAAKRYLVATDKTYEEKLSPASRETLHWQGGAMNEEEIKIFLQQPYYKEIIQVRLWDEAAKDYKAVLLPMSLFKNFIEDYLSHRN
ncbi:MAG: HDIG domain-containing protein [Bacteroidota bacterium]|nr:HDIG domain-containing protein [Bacteroidota bacterium]